MQRAKEDVAANGKTDRDRGKKCGRRRAVLVSPYRGSMGREIGLPGAGRGKSARVGNERGHFFNLRTKRSGARSHSFLVERSLKLDSSSVTYDFLPDRIFSAQNRRTLTLDLAFPAAQSALWRSLAACAAGAPRGAHDRSPCATRQILRHVHPVVIGSSAADPHRFRLECRRGKFP